MYKNVVFYNKTEHVIDPTEPKKTKINDSKKTHH